MSPESVPAPDPIEMAPELVASPEYKLTSPEVPEVSDIEVSTNALLDCAAKLPEANPVMEPEPMLEDPKSPVDRRIFPLEPPIPESPVTRTKSPELLLSALSMVKVPSEEEKSMEPELNEIVEPDELEAGAPETTLREPLLAPVDDETRILPEEEASPW
jgi:hypothetical protein